MRCGRTTRITPRLLSVLGIQRDSTGGGDGDDVATEDSVRCVVYKPLMRAVLVDVHERGHSLPGVPHAVELPAAGGCVLQRCIHRLAEGVIGALAGKRVPASYAEAVEEFPVGVGNLSASWTW